MSRSVPSAKVIVSCRLPSAVAWLIHVEHVLDAVDFLLERRRDRVADHLGGGAGIAGGDDNRRRRDLGVLRDRQGEIGRRADNDDKDRQNAREDRPVDKEVRHVHCGCPLNAGRPSRSAPVAATPWRPAAPARAR